MILLVFTSFFLFDLLSTLFSENWYHWNLFSGVWHGLGIPQIIIGNHLLEHKFLVSLMILGIINNRKMIEPIHESKILQINHGIY
jgi:hypothetical protein